MTSNFARLAGALAVCCAVMLLAIPTHAAMILGDAVPLAELTDDGEMTVGDKKFTNFTYNFTNDMPDASGVNVIPIQDDDGNYGIRFQAAFMDDNDSQGGSDALITYKVEVTDPRFLIAGAHLMGNPNLLGNTGSISVTETFLPLGPAGEFTMDIFDDTNLPTPKLMDSVAFDQGYPMLNVQKDILAFARPEGNDVTLSFVDQTFSQRLIPEPTAAYLLLAGLGSSVMFLRYRFG